MNAKRKPKVIILESDETISGHVQTILTKEGWDVICKTVSKEALDCLTAEKPSLVTLFISNFKLPKMEGDDILSQVKSISPFTQRILMMPGDKSQMLINAINKADIHACIISPFKDEVLIHQAKNCYKQFKHTMKKEQLKRIIHHQNKQMFNIAHKLKKKGKNYQRLIDEKNAQIIKLNSKKSALQNQTLLNADINLDALLEHRNITGNPKTYYTEFVSLCDGIKILFDQLTTRYDIPSVTLDLENLIEPAGSSEETEQTQIIPHILKTAFSIAVGIPSTTPEAPDEFESTEDIKNKHALDEYFKITVSDSKTQAFIKKLKPTDTSGPAVTASDILDLLLQKKVAYGLLDDAEIEIWLAKSKEDRICIAQGEEPVPGEDGVIQFHFQTDYTNAGKINEDGTIDFRNRGDIPYTTEDTLLAEKKPAKQGNPGITISGTTIPINEVVDPVFAAGTGTRMSEDEACIYATISGQPHLDKLGTISVNPELVIPKDVDYETGNIDFKGNITVKGMIKEGFTVKGINLTVQEIEGGTIDLSGDLNVSSGITDSTILVQGNTQAKFINHSTVMGYGDLTVSKEIIDSKIILSGKCINPTGHIISSQVTAKLGIEAGDIGTSSSIPVKLKVGVDDHTEILDKQIDEDLKIFVAKAKTLKDEIKKLEEQDRTLYEQISEKAQVQDRSQVEITRIKKIIPAIEKSNNLVQVQQLTNKIKKLQDAAQASEKELNRIFKTQDQIAKDIEACKKQLKHLEEKNKALVLDKKALKEFSMKTPPEPFVSVGKTITQDTLIKGAHSSKFLKEDQKHCKIIELSQEENGIILHEIKIIDF